MRRKDEPLIIRRWYVWWGTKESSRCELHIGDIKIKQVHYLIDSCFCVFLDDLVSSDTWFVCFCQSVVYFFFLQLSIRGHDAT